MSTTGSITFTYRPGNDDGLFEASANGMIVGEVIRSTARTWNIAENRPDSITFFEAIDLDGEFCDPTFGTQDAAAAYLARRAAITTEAVIA